MNPTGNVNSGDLKACLIKITPVSVTTHSSPISMVRSQRGKNDRFLNTDQDF